MIEPIYTYIKGQGWVVKNPLTFTLGCGHIVRYENRMPAIGERFCVFTSDEIRENYMLELENYPQGFRLKYYSEYKGNSLEGKETRVTLVVVGISG